MADTSYVHLGITYGLNPSQGLMKIKDLPAYGTWPAVANNINNAKVRYPDAYGFLKYRGWSDEKFLNLSAGSAAAVDAVYSGQYGLWGQACMSRVNIDWPEGDYHMTTWAPFCMGQYRGQGPHSGWNIRQAATVLHVWKDQWQESDPHQMGAMRTTNWGIDTGGEAWVHGGSIDMMGFVGNNGGWYNPAYTESGLILWDMGESSNVGRIWASNFNGYGVEVIRGTPFTANCIISSFTNALGAVGIMDGQLGTFNFGTISGDDSPALVVFDSKYGRGAGGNVNIGLLKVESGKRVPNKGQIAIWQRAACVGVTNIGVCQGDQNDLFNDAAFVMKSREWGQTLVVNGFVGWNLRTFVHDVSAKKRWAGTSYHPMVFVYCSRNGGTMSDLVTLQQIPSTPVNANDRLGMVPNNGTFDYANGTPAYSITGGTTPPPDPVACTGWETGPWSAWGPCVNGQQTRTRTVTTTPAGCTGTPPNRPTDTETQACTAPPPVGTMTATASVNNVPAELARITDGNPNTAWQAKTSMVKDQWVRMDYGAAASRNSVSFDIEPGYLNSFPRTFDVETSTNGTNWSVAKAGVAGAYPTCTATFTARNCRYIRIVVKTANPNWLCISSWR